MRSCASVSQFVDSRANMGSVFPCPFGKIKLEDRVSSYQSSRTFCPGVLNYCNLLEKNRITEFDETKRVKSCAGRR